MRIQAVESGRHLYLQDAGANATCAEKISEVVIYGGWIIAWRNNALVSQVQSVMRRSGLYSSAGCRKQRTIAIHRPGSRPFD
jgi:hypothetical protein